MITYQIEPKLSANTFVDLLRRSTLAARRPVDQPQIIEGMLRKADVIATARSEEGSLVGVARSITDFHYCTYLSDLAVDEAFQRQGIGRRLIEFSHQQAGLQTNLILLAAPAAATYYPYIGMESHPSCWIRRAAETPHECDRKP
ncbi:GNAT family N-acetyltransferase [Roseiconus lacunae]|uniref:GNAT family N-acetyltransferase n=1 Tax=Roseiconus lacunae TaxID=2605694 RepID=A0ABT7PQ99_9BACT|nr:GNAT family N-acetyltransferase [Roseiconus lacunae]MDM4018687.1 GNAT family N-acetyltransferase [Roseiconus lacunae]WRQ51454.1 GNAT family N-acetyltransferase [Stieleria sp. HD01]